MNFYTIHKNSELINERSKPGEGVKLWDKWLLGLSAIMYLLIIIVAGIDSGRLRLKSDFNLVLSVTGVLFMIIGQIIFLTARSQNQFFSSVMRIQKERGHVVCDTGLYKTVRHPGYLGMILSLIGIPFITNSSWSIVPTFVAIFLLLLRTAFEDKTLRIELDGYAEYSERTRYKLIPLIW
ncbi:MAG: isoprenylcysteine carboxylmethyltransferase family protein [Bacteroidales bacterium]|nr:isoprenylcysteine carboxylmethyltransferase family protein [Bacteroidales bacterium]